MIPEIDPEKSKCEHKSFGIKYFHGWKLKKNFSIFLKSCLTGTILGLEL